MENRLYLNKRPTYELPDEVIIGEYIKRPNVKHCRTPNFKPDICLNTKYKIETGEKKSSSDQIWIKTDNLKLIEFIKEYDFSSKVISMSIKHLYMWKFKKIILDEFYNKK